MGWYSGLEPILRRNEPLAARTTFGIGGRAAFFIEPRSEADLSAAYPAALRSGLTVYILGGGSNLLVADDGVPGIVVCMTGLADKSLSTRGSCVQVRAGTSLEKTIVWTARAGLSGLECLAGIPGTVGGAVRMNAGGTYGNIGDRVVSVWCVDRNGRIYARPGHDVQWGYRATDLRDPIVRVEFDLYEKPPEAVKERRAQILGQKRAAQPIRMRSAGCFFKNPTGEHAGQLIESAGLKGSRVGEACVSETHANFIVNLGRATAGEVLALSETVREEVSSEFGVELENEVCFWGLPQDGAMVERQLSKPALLPGLAHLPSGRGTTAVQKRKNRVSLVSAR